MQEIKRCLNCNKVITRGAKEREARWQQHLWCSGGCAAKSRRIEILHRPCPICNRTYSRRVGERHDVFTKRQTCGSPHCVTALLLKKKGLKPRQAAPMRPAPISGPVESVEAFLARGGNITRVKSAYADGSNELAIERNLFRRVRGMRG